MLFFSLNTILSFSCCPIFGSFLKQSSSKRLFALFPWFISSHSFLNLFQEGFNFSTLQRLLFWRSPTTQIQQTILNPHLAMSGAFHTVKFSLFLETLFSPGLHIALDFLPLHWTLLVDSTNFPLFFLTSYCRNSLRFSLGGYSEAGPFSPSLLPPACSEPTYSLHLITARVS